LLATWIYTDIEGSRFECFRQCVLDVRYMRNSDRVHGPLPPAEAQCGGLPVTPSSNMTVIVRSGSLTHLRSEVPIPFGGRTLSSRARTIEPTT